MGLDSGASKPIFFCFLCERIQDCAAPEYIFFPIQKRGLGVGTIAIYIFSRTTRGFLVKSKRIMYIMHLTRLSTQASILILILSGKNSFYYLFRKRNKEAHECCRCYVCLWETYGYYGQYNTSCNKFAFPFLKFFPKTTKQDNCQES